ncbi:MAG TPA: hypothetical protein DEA47_02080 [Peptococcaceae bacterium]|nr:MAG: hypothetical protein XD50_0142 [Clostridia bacterium 41_269]HBT20147.1 hypothetical protein [Peptococcaceae bacterium]
MRRFINVYAVLLWGIGLGLFISGFVLAAFPQKPSKMEIEEMARNLGMVYREEVVVYDSGSSDKDAGKGEEKSEKRDVPVAKGSSIEKSSVITVRVEPGLTLEQVGNLLAKEGVIENQESFVVLVQKMGLSDKLIAGTYTFKRGEDVSKIINALTSGKKEGS